MRNVRPDEAQAGIKIARRNINNFRYVGDTILMVEREEELKSLLIMVKEKSEKAGLKLNTKKKTNKQKKTQLRSWPLVPSLHSR